MKKLITLFAFLLVTALTMAQTTLQPTKRGNFVIGTRMGFSAAKASVDVQSSTGSIKGDGGTSVQLNLSPAIGYFFANNFVIGVGMDLFSLSSSSGIDVTGNDSPPQDSRNNNVLFGPFVRYFFPVSDDQAFFIGSALGFGSSKNRYTADNETQTINNTLLSVGVGPGFTIYSNKGLALETLVKYNFAKSKSEIDVQGVRRVSETWSNGVDFSVGLQYYFGGFRSASR